MVTEWHVFYYLQFQDQLRALKNEVKLLSIKNPNTYKSHEKTKMLARVVAVIFQDVAINPQAPHFKLGKTLGEKNKAWKRAKDRMPPRYRLFF